MLDHLNIESQYSLSQSIPLPPLRQISNQLELSLKKSEEKNDSDKENNEAPQQDSLQQASTMPSIGTASKSLQKIPLIVALNSQIVNGLPRVLASKRRTQSKPPTRGSSVMTASQ